MTQDKSFFDDIHDNYVDYVNGNMDIDIDMVFKIVKRNSDMILHSKNEMKNVSSNVVFHIVAVNEPMKKKIFSVFILAYYFNLSNLRKKQFLGLDFEFNNREIALMQMNFELDKDGYIFLLDPTEIYDVVYDFFITDILGNKNVVKILHGSDALDIPYVFDGLLRSDQNTIKNFMRTFIDTRFLCEYIKDDSKCTIYNALLFFGTIDKQKHEFLEQTHENMGDPEDISWNAYTMDKYYILYGLYDVIFLKKFYYDMFNYFKYNVQDNDIIFTNIIPELTRVSFLERRKVTNVMDQIKKEIDPMNNYRIKGQTLVTIFNKIVDTIIVFIIEEPLVKIVKLRNINFLRKYVTIICKNVLYHVLSNKYTIYKTKNNINTKKIYINDIIDYFKSHNMKHLVMLTMGIKNYINQNINNFLS